MVLHAEPYRFGRTAITVEEARNRILERCKLNDKETVPLESAFNRRQGEDFFAPHDYPHFTRSGMDGFAILSKDTTGCSSDQCTELEVVDDIPCGHVPNRELRQGEAARIMTGAKLPANADAVIMLEMTESFQREGKFWIRIKREIPSGSNVAWPGCEISQGELLIRQGDLIEEGELAILSTYGARRVEVIRRPKVAIIPTGQELQSLDEVLTDGRIKNSNGYMLSAQVIKAGGIPKLYEPIGDSLEALELALKKAYQQSDLIITTGGVSVGDKDVLAELFESWQGELLFNKVMMRPGSPTSAGLMGEKLLLALSGNPGACFVGFELFARPALAAILGDSKDRFTSIEAYMDVDFHKVNAYERYVQGTAYYREGQIFVSPAGMDKSSIMRTISKANCLIIIPPGTGIHAGERVSIIKLASWV